MKILLLFASLSFVSFFAMSQINRVDFKSYSNGKYEEGADFSMFVADGVVYLSKKDDKIKQFTDFNKSQNVNIINYNGELFKTVTDLQKLDKPVAIKDSIVKIMGYNCKLAEYNSFSNKIEVWFTTEAKFAGSPYKSFIPTPNALVLKVVINGNREMIATEIKKDKKADLPEYNYDLAKQITDSEFEELKILSRYSIYKIFEKERINFDPELAKFEFSASEENIVYHLSNGGIVLKKVKLPAEARSNQYCFAKLSVESAGDAYDRTGTVFILPDNSDSQVMLKAMFEGKSNLPSFTDKTGQEYQGMIAVNDFYPQTEIMRFFTSFGAGHFNNLRPINNYDWANEIIYKQDVTDLIPNSGEYIWVGAFIGNYDKGGHIISLELDFYPEFEENAVEYDKYVLPLFNTVNIMEMSGQNYGRFFRTDTLMVNFEIPENLSNPVLVYNSTGHGGWENGDEFVPKQNKIVIDGQQIYSFVPWRTDCATYRLSNPASGNFSNGMSSSDFSRSNWCPGTLTNPEYIPLTGLQPGNHTMLIIIDQGEDEGGSFSHWSVSGTITGRIYNSK
ncbi:MAG: PNGase F N-terminal domain-containing protein [Bacteroidales bacterium]|nr:PNGase F N-terminal domain-containing protein [Bacteroidales bacterium]